MKILHLNLYHKLPDDFDGDVNDALRVLAGHRELKGLGTPTESNFTAPADLVTATDESSKILWREFLKALEKGKRTVGVIVLENNIPLWPEEEKK